MRVLLFEQWTGGHFFNYLECLIPRLSEIAEEVVVAVSTNAFNSNEFESKVGKYGKLVNVTIDKSVPVANPGLPVRERVRVLQHLRNSASRNKPDYLLVPSADAQNIAMGALGHLGISALPRNITTEATFHCGYGPAISNAKHWLKEFAYRTAYGGATWSHINFVNFLYYEHGLRHNFAWSRRARLVPDPVPQGQRLSRVEARKLLGVPEDGRYVGLLGSLDSRKAVPELLAAFRRAGLPPTDRLLLAGRLDQGFRTLIDREYLDLVQNGRVIILDRYLTEDELLLGFGALDLVCTVYRDFPGLASLLLKALAAGRPVLVHDFGWSRALVKRFEVGATCDVRDISAFAVHLARSLDASQLYFESDATRRLLAFHTIENFTETMLERVKSAAGINEEAILKNWDWVLEAVDPRLRQVY